MRKPEWPGIATAAALICAGTIAFAIWHDPDGFKLKDWQPLIAACIAFAGVAVAYMGAIAKIESDRESDRQKQDQIRNGVYFRFAYALHIFRAEAKTNVNNIKNAKATGTAVDYHACYFDGAPLVTEAWLNLHLFPKQIAFEVGTLKLAIETLHGALDRVLKKSAAAAFPSDNDRGIESLCKSIITNCDMLTVWIESEIG